MTDDKFITDKKGSKKLNPVYLAPLKQFNLIKTLVANSANKDGTVDNELLTSLIDQVELRCKMMAVEFKIGRLDIGKDIDTVQKEALYEFALTEPSNIESQLADEGQIIDIIQDKLNNIMKNLSEFETEVNDNFEKIDAQVDILDKEGLA